MRAPHAFINDIPYVSLCTLISFFFILFFSVTKFIELIKLSQNELLGPMFAVRNQHDLGGVTLYGFQDFPCTRWIKLVTFPTKIHLEGNTTYNNMSNSDWYLPKYHTPLDLHWFDKMIALYPSITYTLSNLLRGFKHIRVIIMIYLISVIHEMHWAFWTYIDASLQIYPRIILKQNFHYIYYENHNFKK